MMVRSETGSYQVWVRLSKGTRWGTRRKELLMKHLWSCLPQVRESLWVRGKKELHKPGGGCSPLQSGNLQKWHLWAQQVGAADGRRCEHVATCSLFLRSSSENLCVWEGLEHHPGRARHLSDPCA